MDELGDSMDAVGSAGKIGGGELERPTVAFAEFGDFGGVSSNEDAIELGTGLGRLEDPGEHGSAGEAAENFAREPGRREACGNNSQDRGLPLFALPRIKYDWNWLCRNRSSLSKIASLPALQYIHRAV